MKQTEKYKIFIEGNELKPKQPVVLQGKKEHDFFLTSLILLVLLFVMFTMLIVLYMCSQCDCFDENWKKFGGLKTCVAKSSSDALHRTKKSAMAVSTKEPQPARDEVIANVTNLKVSPGWANHTKDLYNETGNNVQDF